MFNVNTHQPPGAESDRRLVGVDVGREKRITKGTGFLDLEGHANVYPLLMISE
jgi:hypothetical protein